MKKIVLTGLFILASFSFAATASEIEQQAAAIGRTINTIEQQSAARIQAEERKAEIALDNVAKYSELLEAVQEQIDIVSGEKRVSFYEREYQGALTSLHSLKKDLNNAINANQKTVDAFEKLSAIVGN